MKRKKKIPRAATLIKDFEISKIKITSPFLHIDLASRKERKKEKRLMRELPNNEDYYPDWKCALSIKAIEILSEYGFKLDRYLKALDKQGFIIDKNNETFQELYNQLINKVPTNYDLKECPNCFETEMRLLSVSPTGKSIEYQCAYCNKKIKSRLFPGKEGYECAELFNNIKQISTNIEEEIKEPFIFEESDSFFYVETISNNANNGNQRNYIPESVRHEVWRRDQGRCVKCGSQINLEFDHIIPVSKGGANTARNIQLLCEKCNRSKSDKI